MRRMMQGLVFETQSPSFYSLAPEYTRGHVIDVSFLGARKEWCLFLKDPEGAVTVRCFPDRDAAVGLIAEAFRREGAI